MTSTTRSRGRPRETSAAEIRAVARALFSEHGFDDVSLTRIAQAAGISRTTLFVYFPAKRDLMWEEFDTHSAEVEEYVSSEPDGSLVDVLVGGMLIAAAYTRHEHGEFAERLRIVQGSDELRAYAALGTTDLARRLVGLGISRSPDTSPEYVGDLTHALMAIAARATDDWAADPSPTTDLPAHVSARLERFIAPLRR